MKVQTHDPYRSSVQVTIPRIGDEPYPGKVTVLAHVDRYPPFVNAGAEWMLHAMMRHLVEGGHECHVTTAVKEPVEVDGVFVWPADAARSLSTAADVLVGHLLWTREAVTLAHRSQLPLLYIAHNDFQVRYWKLGEQDVSALVQNAQWVDDRHREDFPHWYGPSIVVRPPCHVRDYRVSRSTDHREGYITLINPNPDKGAECFYEVARRCPDRRFLVVGGGYGHQQTIPRDLENVVYQPPTGQIAEDVYARTRVLMVPSRYESWGRVAVEAMCSGIPVLAHPTPGLVESCGPAGIFCDRDDPAAWVRALEALDQETVYRDRSAAATMRAVELDAAAQRDLGDWERLVRRAAAPTKANRT